MSNNNGRIAVNPQAWRDARELLEAIRPCLKRWSARYAGSDHAKKHVIETALLVERIDEWLLRT
jgi:hypothetical protein